MFYRSTNLTPLSKRYGLALAAFFDSGRVDICHKGVGQGQNTKVDLKGKDQGRMSL